ncbi:MAG: tetratricopeptide repeat protein [Thiobacillus sp.]
MKRIGAMVLMCLAAGAAHAADNTTAQEIAMLPPYCDAKIGKQEPAAVEMWRARMGHDNWIHMHHYCSGLVELNRYYRSARGRQRANLGNAINEFSGMLKAWTPDFYLRAEAHMNRGRALKYSGRDGQALADFEKALELDPGLSPARIDLADLYARLGKKAQALEVLKAGIARDPEKQSLRRRYQELGGDMKALADLKPVPAAPAAEAPADATPPAAKPPVQLVEPKIGSPKNPYCRFCPD